LSVVVNEARKNFPTIGEINLSEMFLLPLACLMLMIFDTEPKICKRCLHDLTGEEKYYLFGDFYCRCCDNIMTYDPEYREILKNIGLVNIET